MFALRTVLYTSSSTKRPERAFWSCFCSTALSRQREIDTVVPVMGNVRATLSKAKHGHP